MKILAVGAIFMDIKGYPLEHFDPKGRNVGTLEYVHGGVIRNIAEDFANMGANCEILSVLDETSLSGEVLKRLSSRGVDTSHITFTADGLGTWLAIFDEKGDVYSSISKRPVLLPIISQIDRAEKDIFDNITSVVVDISDEKEMLERVFEAADKYHIPVYAAVSNMSEAMNNQELFSKPYCLVCNKQEAGILLNDDYEDLNKEEVLTILSQRKDIPTDCLVVTLGNEGACYISKKEGCGICDSFPSNVKDTTGAGDAFFAGLVYALSCGAGMKKACETGSYIAARTIETIDNVCPIEKIIL